MNLQLKIEFDKANQGVMVYVIDADTGTVQADKGSIRLSIADILNADEPLAGRAQLRQVGRSPDSPLYLMGTTMQMLGSDGNMHPITMREEKVYTTVGGICKQRSKFIFSSETFKGAGDPA